MWQETKQTKPGISIFFSNQLNVKELNDILTKEWFRGGRPPIGEDRKLILPAGGCIGELGGLVQFYCYISMGWDVECYLLSAFPFFIGYDSLVWVKDLEGNFLGRNLNFNEDGTICTP